MSSADDVPITATKATVAGSSVDATETEEDATSHAQRGAETEGRVVLTKVDSLEISLGDNDKEEAGDGDDDEEEEYAAPMHLHALRSPAKLRGVRSRSSSRSRPGSRRNSASPPRKHCSQPGGELIVVGAGVVSPSASVESSLDGTADHLSHGSDAMDPDILLDKLGFRDLDPNVTQEEMQELLRKHLSSTTSLPTLNERMSEETMDDVHAFQDLQFVKKSLDELDLASGDPSPSSSARDSFKKAGKGLSDSAVLGSSKYLLNTLDEDEEEEGEEDVNIKLPDGFVPKGFRSNRKERDTLCSTLALAGSYDEEKEGGLVEPESILPNGEGQEKSDTPLALAASSDMGGCGDLDIVLDIQDGVIDNVGRPVEHREITTCSSVAVASASSIDDDDDDDDDAEVEVPALVMEELNKSEGNRRLKHRGTSMAVTGSELDYFEDDEQDGLEADLSNGSDKQR